VSASSWRVEWRTRRRAVVVVVVHGAVGRADEEACSLRQLWQPQSESEEPVRVKARDTC